MRTWAQYQLAHFSAFGEFCSYCTELAKCYSKGKHSCVNGEVAPCRHGTVGWCVACRQIHTDREITERRKKVRAFYKQRHGVECPIKDRWL